MAPHTTTQERPRQMRQLRELRQRVTTKSNDIRFVYKERSHLLRGVLSARFLQGRAAIISPEP